MTTLTEKELIQHYKLRPNFVKTHRRLLGAIGKKCFIYDQDIVEQTLRRMAREAQEAADATPAPPAIPRSLNIVPISDGKIKGRGGRAIEGG